MSSIVNFQSDPTDIIDTQSNSLFIWLDILGFSEAVNDENKYRELSELLKKFQKLFQNCDKYRSKIISDGIVLYVQEPQIEKIESIFKDIATKQFKFIVENNYFIRGGIAIGSRYQSDDSNDLFISNGLARAVNLESKLIDWPVIGIDETNLKELRKTFNIFDDKELFGLMQGYNKIGKTIYFIDFIEENPEYITTLYKKIHEFQDEKQQVIRNKYIWLLRYYLYKFNDTEIDTDFEGIIL